MSDMTMPRVANDVETDTDDNRSWIQRNPILAAGATIFVLILLAFAFWPSQDEPAVETPYLEFTLGPGEGFVDYTDYQTAITLAAEFDRPLYRGQIQTASNRITPNEARLLESTTDQLQVTVGGVHPGTHVYVGDPADPRTWIIDPGP